MTITSENALSQSAMIGVPYMLDGSRMLMRMLSRGAAMTAAFMAVLVWLAPGASWESDVMLFKLGLSIAAIFASVAFWQGSLPPLPPSVEIDAENAELRLVRQDQHRDKCVIERCSFAGLQTVELNGRRIAFWAPGGRLLAEITLSNAYAHAQLLAALRAEGKLS